VLVVRDLTTAYQGLVAISEVNVEVAKGEIVCIAGANGAGKSTLLESIAGLERPRSGEVLFDGERIDGQAPHRITARGLALVPENRRLFGRLSVRDNLRLGSYLFRGDSGREAPLARVMALFPRLSERLDQPAATLSGGEQQMLAIGRASQGLMPKLVDEIFGAVEAIRRGGATVLIVEQRLTECLEIADRAYVLRTGRVLMSGTAAQIRDSMELRQAYLGL
jgi:branched-chain amino acid transport system ATP-binding protein